MNFFIIALVLVAAAVLAWNFIPAVREKMRGWSTVIEAVSAASFVAADAAVQAFQMESEFWSSVVPEGAWQYVSIGLALWFIFKRAITSTGLGEK